MHEAPRLVALGRVVDEIERLAVLADRVERALERVVVVRRDDDRQLAVGVDGAAAGGQRRELMVKPVGLVRAREHRTQHVEQRSLATHDEVDILRDAHEVRLVLALIAVLLGEMLGELASAREVVAVAPVGVLRPVAEVRTGTEERDDRARVDGVADELGVKAECVSVEAHASRSCPW